MFNNALTKIQSLSRRIKFCIMLLLDGIALSLAYLASLLFNGYQNIDETFTLTAIGLVCVLTGLLTFFFLRVYQAVLSQFGRRSILRIFLAALIPAFVVFIYFADYSLSLTMWFFTFMFAAAWRDSRNWFAHRNGQEKHIGERVAIYGAGEAGTQAAASFKHYREYRPVCFFDDNKDIQGRISLDLPIYSPERLDEIVEKHHIDRIILAIPSASRAARNQILNKLENCDVPIQTLPGIRDILSGKAKINDVHDIDPLDLLGRDPVPPNTALLRKCIKNKVIMVTGAGGSIGSELCRQICEVSPEKLILFDVSEYALYNIGRELEALSPKCELISVLGSVQDKDHLQQIIKQYKIETIYHAAAYKHVPLVEENMGEAFKNNTLGTLNTAEAAIQNGVEHFVLISTDKAVRPTSAMGVTKRLAEQAIQALSQEKDNKTKLCFVRFGNVLGSSGSVIPLFHQQIATGGPVTVTDAEMIRYFMSIPEAAQLVIQAGALAESGDAFTLDMGAPVKIIDMAKRLIRLNGLKPKIGNENGDIEIIFTGLRPGEKLYEELFINNSASEATEHPRIRREKENSVTLKTLNQKLKKIAALINRNDKDKLRKTLFSSIKKQ